MAIGDVISGRNSKSLHCKMMTSSSAIGLDGSDRTNDDDENGIGGGHRGDGSDGRRQMVAIYHVYS